MRSVVILGGGLSGVAAAITLARAGVGDVTIIEASERLGGLAGSFESEGRFYPLGYHHILHRDRTLLYFLDRIGALPRVRWRRVKLLFRDDAGFHDLGSPTGFLRFPMRAADKARFVALMLRAFNKADWTDWQDRSAQELIDAWAGPGVRERIFETLTQLRFELPCAELSGAWLGARLHFREGSAPLGYIPEANWTEVLCSGLAGALAEAGVTLRVRSRVASIAVEGDRVRDVELHGGERIRGDLFVSTLPTPIYVSLVPGDATAHVGDLRYTAMISAICAIAERPSPAPYWTNVALRERTASGVFLLSSLNPSIGKPGETCVNFVSHLRSRERPLFHLPEEELTRRYAADFERIFGLPLRPQWWKINRIPMYAPVLTPRFRNPPIRSTSFSNLYFAGNYRTFPSILSTGTAMRSGIQAGETLLREIGASARDGDLSTEVERFRLRAMPHA
jgi:protoporphyrinogen oxidase